MSRNEFEKKYRALCLAVDTPETVTFEDYLDMMEQACDIFNHCHYEGYEEGVQINQQLVYEDGLADGYAEGYADGLEARVVDDV